MESIISSSVNAQVNTTNQGTHQFDAVRIGSGVPFGDIPANQSSAQTAFSLNATYQSAGASAALTAASNAAAVAAVVNGLLKALIDQGVIKSS